MFEALLSYFLAPPATNSPFVQRPVAHAARAARIPSQHRMPRARCATTPETNRLLPRFTKGYNLSRKRALPRPTPVRHRRRAAPDTGYELPTYPPNHGAGCRDAPHNCRHRRSAAACRHFFIRSALAFRSPQIACSSECSVADHLDEFQSVFIQVVPR